VWRDRPTLLAATISTTNLLESEDEGGGCKLDRELTYLSQNLTITCCCVYHDSVWFGKMIWLTK
jgi:hypothetical protein